MIEAQMLYSYMGLTVTLVKRGKSMADRTRIGRIGSAVIWNQKRLPYGL
jgi:hypothetical protein